MWLHLLSHAAMLNGGWPPPFFQPSFVLLQLEYISDRRIKSCGSSDYHSVTLFRIIQSSSFIAREAITETDKWGLILIHPDLGSGWSTLSRHQLYLMPASHSTRTSLSVFCFLFFFHTFPLFFSLFYFHNSVPTIFWPLQLPFVFRSLTPQSISSLSESGLGVVFWWWWQ